MNNYDLIKKVSVFKFNYSFIIYVQIFIKPNLI